MRRLKSYATKLDRAQAEVQENYLSSINTPEIEQIVTREWELFISNSAMQNVSRHFSDKAIEAFKLFSQGVSVTDISSRLDVKADSIYKYISRIKLKLIEEIQTLQKELDF